MNKVFANLGCGPPGSGHAPTIFEDWRELRVDIESAVKPDILADITDLSAIPSNSMDGVWCSHALEHVYAHQVEPTLAEIYRIQTSRAIWSAAKSRSKPRSRARVKLDSR